MLLMKVLWYILFVQVVFAVMTRTPTVFRVKRFWVMVLLAASSIWFVDGLVEDVVADEVVPGG